jgi:hypothetical protein
MSYRCEVSAYHYAYLSSDFGRDLAMKHFRLTLDELEAKVGRYQKGKRKGELKGKLTWDKIEKGGWYKTGRYDEDAQIASGYVTYAQTFNYNIVDSWTGELILSDGRDRPLANGQPEYRFSEGVR